jgi:uncharacterized membrane protein
MPARVIITLCSVVLLNALHSWAQVSPSVVNAAAPTAYTFTTIDVPFTGASDTAVTGINQHGAMVGGHLTTPATEGTAFGLSPAGKFLLIPLLSIQDINGSGHFTGWYSSPNGLVGFLYTKDTFLTLTTDEFNLTEATGLNDLDEVVGDYRDAQGFHSFLWRDGEFTTVDPPFDCEGGSGATAINNAGVIVGTCDPPRGYLNDHGVFSLIQVPGATTTLPRSINNHSVITGVYCVTDRCHGFVLEDGVFTTIDVPGSTLTDISGMNDLGQLVGRYIDAQGVAHGFLATPSTAFVEQR